MATIAQDMNLTQHEKVIWMAMHAPGLNGRRGLPYCLVGQPGTVKTTTISRLSKLAGLPFNSILGSLRPPTDFMGVPVPRRRELIQGISQHLSPDGDPDYLYMHYAPSGWAMEMAIAQHGVVLFDEANTCPPSTQAALLRVLFEGMVGELQLPSGVRMFLAMNATQDAAGGWDIAPALANRVGWLPWPAPMIDGWSRYMAGGCSTPDLDDPVATRKANEADFDAGWESAFARAIGTTTGFLRAKPDQLHKRPADAQKASEAWPSPRTWELATRAYAGSLNYGFDELTLSMATSAFIGADTFGEFYTWAKAADLPDPLDLLEGRCKFEHKPARIDRTAAVLSACQSLVTSRAKSDRQSAVRLSNTLWGMVKDMPDNALDLCIAPVEAMINGRLTDASSDWGMAMARMEPMITSAGIRRS